MKKEKVFLLLQGPASPFFSILAKEIKRNSSLCKILSINFNCGDWLFKFNCYDKCFNFNGSLDELPMFLSRIHREYRISDVFLFGDNRPIHCAAIKFFRNSDVKLYVFEEGYFRPFWITLEENGVNLNSSVPKAPSHFLEYEKLAHENYLKFEEFRCPFWKRAFYDVVYHFSGMVNFIFFSNYKKHALDYAIVEYLGYAYKFIRLLFLKKVDAKKVKFLVEGEKSFFIVPLQLNSDYQIRKNSTYNSMLDFLDEVVKSFAENADASNFLLVKAHPLEYSFLRYRRNIEFLCKKNGLNDKRVIFIENGDLEVIVKKAKGMVTVNSTSAMIALENNCPVIALGGSIYNMPGLTYYGKLDEFWNSFCLKTDRDLFYGFKRFVILETQVNGGFYCDKGIRIAVKNIVKKINFNLKV